MNYQKIVHYNFRNRKKIFSIYWGYRGSISIICQTRDVLDLIGNTPMVKVNHFDTGVCSLYLKLESANPGGSIKDRIGLSMITEAEKSPEFDR